MNENEPFLMTWAHVIVPLAASLFFVDMFLGWHGASVNVAGVVSVDGTASAWNGWGAIAGIAAAALVVWSWARVASTQISQQLKDEVVTAILGVTTLLFTVVELFSGTAAVNVASTVTVETALRWPAFAGLALSAVIALTSLVELIAATPRHSGRIRLHTS